MNERFNIESAGESILNGGRLVEISAEVPAGRTFDAGDANAVVAGARLPGGAGVKGRRSLLVEGSLQGEAQGRCRIEVDGDVVVTGGVAHADLTGRSIRIGGDARECRLAACNDITVCGDMADARVMAGRVEPAKRQIEALRQQVVVGTRQQAFAERQVTIEGKRVEKMIRGASSGIDFNVGKIVQCRRKRISVDLAPFYRATGAKDEEAVISALKEFYAKAVVGVLTKKNRAYIAQSTNRRTIFTSMVRSLYDLFMLTYKRDRELAQLAGQKAEAEELAEVLRNRTVAVYVKGYLMPKLDIQIVLPHVEAMEDGEISIGMDTVKMQVGPGPDDAHLEVVLVDKEGEGATSRPEAGELQGLAISAVDGKAAWEHTSVPQAEAAA
jgi:hypothetical protein